MQELVALFSEMIIAERGASANTVRAYQQDLRDLESFLQTKKTPLELAAKEQIEEYMRSFSDMGLSSKTQNRRLSAIREFYRFLFSEDYIKKNPTDYLISPKTQKSLPKYLTEDEISLLINKAQDIRMQVLLEVLYATGMRVSELVSLPVQSVLEQNQYISVLGKGNKERIVPLTAKAAKLLDEWLIEREFSLKKGRTSKWLFPSSSGSGHLTRDGFFKSLKKTAILAGISPEKVSPHVFRHSFASHLIAHNADLRSVQQLLGHADIATTEIYTHIQVDRLKKTVEKSHPLSYTVKKGIK